ncbi:MAG: glycosyltransferase N-terminal domain-containing protein [Bacteroidota bacterium]|nr:glycosyltransferase N-terminal domain-containing protein [Bacteroidota bacterium]
MSLIYDTAIAIYVAIIRIAALFNPKARQWVVGRKHIFRKIKVALNGNTSPVIWVHCASLGEFEQGRPVIEAIREQHPDTKIFLTFFSPSGFEIRKNYQGADYIFYLPADMPYNASRFIRLVSPSLVVIVKYEFWFNYLHLLRREQIPTLIISAIFRPSQHFFRWYGGWFRKNLRGISHFFVQSDQSAQLLRSIGIAQVTVSGDTRFDRVAAIAEKCKSFPLIEQYRGNGRLFLAGSTWPADEELIKTLCQSNQGFKYIIAPHEVHEEHIRYIEQLFGGQCIRYSKATPENISKTNILIIDSIGILSNLYQYAYIAYIGGAFGKGLHNILEAATFGKPVIFGPNYTKFKEAVDLVELGGVFSIHNAGELIHTANQLSMDETVYMKASGQCSGYVALMRGATSLILLEIHKHLSLKR